MGIEPMTVALLAQRAADCAMRPIDTLVDGDFLVYVPSCNLFFTFFFLCLVSVLFYLLFKRRPEPASHHRISLPMVNGKERKKEGELKTYSKF